MADSGQLMKIGLFGAAGYLAWRYFFASPATPAPSSGAPAAGAPSSGAAASTPATTPAAASPSVLDGIFTRIQDSVPSGVTGTPDEWGWYLNNELTKLGKGAAPDPVAIFGPRPQSAITLAAWWAGMAPALKTQLGLAGLGMYGTVAQFARKGYR